MCRQRGKQLGRVHRVVSPVGQGQDLRFPGQLERRGETLLSERQGLASPTPYGWFRGRRVTRVTGGLLSAAQLAVPGLLAMALVGSQRRWVGPGCNAVWGLLDHRDTASEPIWRILRQRTLPQSYIISPSCHLETKLPRLASNSQLCCLRLQMSEGPELVCPAWMVSLSTGRR